MLSFLLAFSLWAVLHSFTASFAFKDAARGLLGDRYYDGLYRLFYNLLSVVTFIPVLYLAALALPDGELWSVAWPYSLALILVQLVGLAGLLISLLQTDLMRFAGIGQAVRLVQRVPQINPPPRLVTGGMYGLVRHPLYFFSLLILWFVPTMSWRILVFNLAATLYFWIGSVFEERKLASVYGEAYLQYKEKVPRLLPLRVPSSK